MATPKDLISINDFSEMQDSYVSHVRSKDQTKSVWFDIDTIKEYISFIENEAKNKEITISGLRMYFIAKEDVNRAMNIAICPTYKDKNSRNEDEQVSFDPIHSSNHRPATLTSLQTNPPSSAISSILNKGILCPPKCPEE